jgi:hypothetical protein
MADLIQRLLKSKEPTVRYKTLVHVLGKSPKSTEARKARNEMKQTGVAPKLLAELRRKGTIPRHPYSKWRGAHWILAALADMGYPPGEKELLPLREQVYEWLLSEERLAKIRTISGRTRRCASQEGNALYYLITLGLDDERTPQLADWLIKWQWPDGGWNCDRNPEAVNSSYHESLIPLRALNLHAGESGDKRAEKAVNRAVELFLKRRLYKRLRDGKTIKSQFTRLHYPYYWYYNTLYALKVMAEAGCIDDERCKEALDLLESKRLRSGAFPANKRYYCVRANDKRGGGISATHWGPTDKNKANEFVTVDALIVIKAARRSD